MSILIAQVLGLGWLLGTENSWPLLFGALDVIERRLLICFSIRHLRRTGARAVRASYEGSRVACMDAVDARQ